MDQVFQRVCPFSDFLLANPKRRQREKHREDLRGVQKGQIWVFLLSTIRKSLSLIVVRAYIRHQEGSVCLLYRDPWDPRSNLQKFQFAISITSHGLERNFPGKIVGDFVFIL